MVGHWEHFHHEADVGVRGIGPTRADAFAQAATAMTAVVTDPESVIDRTPVAISCQAPEDALLLADWLNALILEMAVRHVLFRRFEVAIEDGRLEATAWGEAVDVARHQPAVELKGATYTALDVRQRPDGWWVAQCVVDV